MLLSFYLIKIKSKGNDYDCMTRMKSSKYNRGKIQSPKNYIVNQSSSI